MKFSDSPGNITKKRKKMIIAISICIILVLLSVLAYLLVKDEMLRVSVHYHSQADVAVYVDGTVLASVNLSHPNVIPAIFSRSIYVTKGMHTIKVVEEITDALGIVTVDVYGTLYVNAFISDGRISFQVTSREILFP